MAYTRFSVCLNGDEADAFKEALKNSEFDYSSRQRFRSNGEYAEFVRYLVQEEMMDDG